MRLVDAYALAHQLDLSPVTIRQWAHKGHIKRRGTGQRGWALYDIDEVLTFAKTRGLAPQPQDVAGTR